VSAHSCCALLCCLYAAAAAAAVAAAASRGGALSVTESGKATIVQSTFTDAHATTAGGSAGGAIYTEGAVACTDTVFTNTSGTTLATDYTCLLCGRVTLTTASLAL
jgi:hypothetical protein